MAYKLDKSGYYVDSSGQRYDAASGWSSSGDGKTLTNSYTGQTVSDVGSGEKKSVGQPNTEARTVTNGAGTKEIAGTGKASTAASRSRAGSAANQSSTIQNANAALSAVNNLGPASGMYDTGAISSQQQALDMMKLGSQKWGETQYDTLRNQYATGNQNIAEQWFPGATRDANGVWYYNGQPLYDQSFSGNSYAPSTGTNADQELRDMFQWSTMPNGTPLNEALAAHGKNVPQQSLADMYGAFTLQSATGQPYTVGSDKGIDFILNAPVGSTMIGGDGSQWTKNADGSISVITKDGTLYTRQGNISTVMPEEFVMPEMPQALQEYAVPEVPQALLQLAQQVQEFQDNLKNYQPFEYDPNTDPLYMQYADSYTRGGQRAMTDVIGQLAARTGGLASSYAGSMAQQTYDNYMADLANKIPELQQLAYSMYVDQYNRDVGDYNRMYNQYRDQYGDYRDDLEFSYRKYRDDYNDWYNQTQDAYDRYRDTVGDQRWNLTNTQDMNQQALENARSSESWALQKAANERANRIEDEQIAWERQQADLARQDAARQEQKDAVAELWDQVNRYGRIPSLSTVLSLGLTQQDYQDMVNQAQRIRASDATRYYGGW